MHKIAARHLAAIKSGAVTRSNIIGIRKLVSASTRAANGWSVGGGQAVAPIGEVYSMLDAILEHKPAAVGELLDGGLRVLRSPRYKRQTAAVAAMLADIAEIRLVDYSLEGHGGRDFRPTWRARTVDGRGFDYQLTPWQSGGAGPEIFNVNRAGGAAHA